jgi:hypothetical protein
MGSSQAGIHTGRRRHGFGQYYMGSYFPYFLATCIFRMREPPYVTGGLSMLWGYLKAWAGARISMAMRNCAASSAPISAARSWWAAPAPWPRSRPSARRFSRGDYGLSAISRAGAAACA